MQTKAGRYGRKKAQNINLPPWLFRAPIGACMVSFAFDFLRLFAAIKLVDRSAVHAGPALAATMQSTSRQGACSRSLRASKLAAYRKHLSVSQASRYFSADCSVTAQGFNPLNG
ncbi:MAG: hypothetical protein IPN11_17325 [Opitutaceae bacterium]|nr:hypothetical protein [Opitutaceae bacterium]